MRRFPPSQSARLLASTGLLLAVSFFSGMTNSAIVAQEPPREGQGYTDTPQLPNQMWRVHDKYRPRPAVVVPGEQLGSPPSDATVLFDGTQLDAWRKAGTDQPAGWKIDEGAMVAQGGSGSIETKESFGDVQLHLEWSAPEPPRGEGQGRGNSGVIFMGRYEVQVLDSFQSDTYADGQAASIYGQFPPQVNAMRPPGQWQVYDIIFEAPRFDGDKLARPAKVTVFHNGVLVQHATEMIGQMAHQQIAPYVAHPPKGHLLLQDHGDPVRFRNIWIRPLREEIDPWLTFPAGQGAGHGKKVVLIAGDEEYRSEESLPMLADLLSKKHGFHCSVLFPIHPETGTVDPNYGRNIPGTHLLEDADLMIIATRFRHLPDWQMKPIVDFVERGGAVIGLRTATHAFNYPGDSDSPYKDWSFNSGKWPGGFGQQILGDTWVSHHGNHKVEATRGVVAPGAGDSTLLKGVDNVFGPSDVYGITHLPKDAQVLLLGQVLTGMNPTDAPVEGNKNDPMMPLAWTRVIPRDNGSANRVFCTTMGASVDLANEGLRRLVVNACYWATGLEDAIPAKSDVEIEGKYEPTFYGFHPGDHFKNQRLKPVDFLVR